MPRLGTIADWNAKVESCATRDRETANEWWDDGKYAALWIVTVGKTALEKEQRRFIFGRQEFDEEMKIRSRDILNKQSRRQQVLFLEWRKVE